MGEPAPGNLERTAELPASPGAGPHSLSNLLGQVNHLDRASFLAMLRADQRKRWQRGDRVLVEAYIARLPDLAGDEDALLDLIYSEVVLRGELGETPTPEEYVARFPKYEAPLRRQFALNEVLNAESLLDIEAPEPPKSMDGMHTQVVAGLGTPVGPTHNANDSLRVPAPRTVAEGGAPPSSGSRANLALLPTVPGYILLEELGRGGMGVVYKARQIALKRTVALKMILAGAHAGPHERGRLRAEAEAVARLQHPNIVQIYEVGEQDSLPYLALEYVDGGGLDRKLNGTPLPPREAAAILVPLCQAMDYAHQQGVVHRDLKPANVLLRKPRGDDGKKQEEGPRRSSSSIRRPPGPFPMVTDFGLAKQLESGPGPTRSGMVVGTPSYMAPEQAADRGRNVGPLADVYALGAILYECLTGRPPFRAATPVDTVLQVLSEEPVRPIHLNTTVPLDLETICLKCLEKEPKKRYASALDLGADVQRYLDGEPILARPIRWTERLVKWARRRPGVAALSSALGALFAISFVVVMSLWLRAADARDAERLALANEKHEKALKNAALEEAEDRLYFNRITLADREWWSNNLPGVEELLGHYSDDRRGWEWHYLKRLCHADLQTVPGQRCVAYSPDGKWLATAAQGGTAIHLWDAETGRPGPMLKGHTDRVNHLAFAPDSKFLASAGADRVVKLWDVTAWQEVATLTGHTNPVLQTAFAPDGRLLASADDNDTVKLWDMKTGKELRSLAGDTTVAFSPDGKLLATAAGDSDIKLWDPATGGEVHTLHGPDGVGIRGVAFSPDGKWLVSAGNDQTLRLWELATRQERRTIYPRAGQIARVVFSPDGRWLAAASGDATVPGGVKLFDALTGQELRAYRWLTRGGTDVAFHPQGGRLAVADADVIKVWDAASDQEARTLRGPAAAAFQSVAFSLKGESVAAGAEDGTLCLWDPRTGRTLASNKEHTRCIWSVAFSPDGKWLATAGEDHVVLLREPHTGAKVRELPHTGAVLSLAFRPDSRQLATVTQGEDREDVLTFWDVAGGARERTLAVHKVTRLAYRPNGTQLVGLSRFTVHIWDGISGGELRTLQSAGAPFSGVVYSPDGRYLLTTVGVVGNGEVKVWNANTGALVLTIPSRGNSLSQLAYSPDGRRLAVAGWDHTVKLWDPRTGQDVLTLRGHAGRVTSVAFSPDGCRIASASTDHTVRLWDATPLPGKHGP